MLFIGYITSNLGIAIIILTVIFRLILFPLSKKQIKTQIKMKEIQGPLEELKKKYKDKREEMGRAMMGLYKKYEINPFSGLLLLIIQLPLLIGFYYVFLRAGLPEINMDLMYSFVPQPEYMNTTFLGFIDMTAKSPILAAIAGIAQYFQMKLLMPKTQKKNGGKGQMMNDVMKGVQGQMTYVMPIIMVFIAYSFGAIVALYLVVSNIFSLCQELYIRRTIKRPEEERIEKEQKEITI